MAYYEDEIKRLKKEQDREKKLEESKNNAQNLRDIWGSFVEVGFTEEQAYELLTIYLKK